MAPLRHNTDLIDVVYRQVRLYEPDTVAITTIKDPNTKTLDVSEQRFSNVDDETRAIADIVATTHIDLLSSDAVLTSSGYTHKRALKDALVKIDSNSWRDTLKTMLKEGAYIYEATRREEVVGVVVLIRLTKEFTIEKGTQGILKHGGDDLPNPNDLKAVRSYAKCGSRDRMFTRQLCAHLNSHLRYHGIGKLWELSALGVKEEYRHHNLGSTLIRLALSRVPRGNKVILQADPGIEAMYRHFGFRYAISSESNTIHAITLSPSWGKQGTQLVLPMMILHK